MSTHRANFDAWFRKSLELLYHDREAGFPILLITFPLLERYLRQKTGLTFKDDLSSEFFDELLQMFPRLTGHQTARNFWQVYRNGLLHELTLSRQTRGGTLMPTGWLSHDEPLITIAADGSMWIHPVDFARTVVKAIEDDFGTFEGASPTASRLPTAKPHLGLGGASAVGNERVIIGTNTDP